MTDAPKVFETILLEGDPKELPAPTNGPYYVATQQGYFAMVDSAWGHALTPITENANLPKAESLYWANIKHKLPSKIIIQAWSFFRAIYQKQRSEAMVDIIWRPDKGYSLFVPPQTATGGGVNARRNLEHYRGQMVGTIHSHCMMSAFHSGTDTHDAEGHDGLHLTIGKVLDSPPEIAVMFSRGGVYWEKTLKLENVMEGTLGDHELSHPSWWERYVSQPTPGTNIIKWNGSKPHSTIITPTTPRSNNMPPYAGLFDEDDWNMGWSPTTTPPITTKYISLNSLASIYTERYGAAQPLLEQIQHDLDEISWMLDRLGIDVDIEFQAQAHPVIDLDFIERSKTLYLGDRTS